MRLISLQSGSSGNCIYVESGDVRLLFDAGLTGTQVQGRLAANGCDAAGIDGLFISHDHSDHIRCAGVVTRKFGMPLYVTRRTLSRAKRRMQLDERTEVQHFRAGEAVKVRHVTVETISTPHDAVDGVVFVVDDGVHRLAICTDVGHVFGDLKSIVESVDGLFLESNYDERMLANGDYPYSLKRRISGPGGHISNREAAELVEGSATSRLKWLCLAHLSGENNSPDLALAAHRERLGTELPIFMTSRAAASSALTLEGRAPAFIQRPDPAARPLERFFTDASLSSCR